MKTYVVTLNSKSILSKNVFIVKAKTFSKNLMTRDILFIDEDDTNVAMFKESDIRSIAIKEEED